MVVEDLKRELKLLYFKDYKDEVILDEMLLLLKEHPQIVKTDTGLVAAQNCIQLWKQGHKETWDCLQDVIRSVIS